MVQNETEWCRVVNRVVQSGTKWYRVVQSGTEWNRVMYRVVYRVVQSETEWYRVVQNGAEVVSSPAGPDPPAWLVPLALLVPNLT